MYPHPPKIAVLIIVSTIACCWSNRPAHAEISWEADLRTAHTKATQEGKLMLLHFYSDKCIWCDRLEAGAYQSAEVAEAIEQDYVAVKIHAGKNPQLAQSFRVKAYPTDVIVTPAGTALSHRTSPQIADQYVAMLAQHAENRPPAANLPAEAATAADSNPTIAASTPATGPEATPAAATTMTPAAPQPSSDQIASAAVTDQTSEPTATPSERSATPVIAASSRSAATDPAPAAQKLAMDGYCAVTLLADNRWTEGDPQFGVIHLGSLYLFADEEKMATFLNDPEPYTPVLNGIDVVRFFEEKRVVAGKRDFGVRDPEFNRMFFFADEAAMIHFENQYARYTEAAINVTRQAVADANPRR